MIDFPAWLGPALRIGKWLGISAGVLLALVGALRLVSEFGG